MDTLTIFEALRESHDIQREYCSRLSRTRASNPSGRLEAFRTLKLELAAHAAAEERFLYAPILMEDAGLDSARHALAEHHKLDELAAALTGVDPGSDGWGDKAKALTHEARHHLKEEEQGFFKVAGRILSDPHKLKLAKQYLRDYARMKKTLAAQWGWAEHRAHKTDTPAVKKARQGATATPPAKRVARVVGAVT